MADKPWYKDGLRFKCTACGDCCTGAPGFVWVNKEEMEALAAAAGVEDLEEFEQQYVRKVGIRRSLREFPNGDCVFFDSDSRKCQVYQARPRQCRTWPFWPSTLASPETWTLMSRSLYASNISTPPRGSGPFGFRLVPTAHVWTNRVASSAEV